MKISELIAKQAADSLTKAHKPEKAEQAFGNLLSQEMQNAATIASGQTEKVQGVSPLTVASGASALDQSAVQRLASEIENTLNQWSDISTLVATPDSSSKEVQSRIGSLMDTSRSLQQQCDALPQDHPLRQIADELNVFSYVESIKWQRGDYLS